MTTKEVMFDSVEDVKRFVQQSEKQPAFIRRFPPWKKRASMRTA